MKIIVAGFPKTGTKSMDEALTQLGYKVYGHTENLLILEKEWTKVFYEGATIEDFRKMYEDVDAVSDVPACYFWEEILWAFPDSKIIFMRRKNEDEWFNSLKNQIENFHKNFAIRLLKTTSPTQWRIEKNVASPTARLALGYVPPAIWSNNIRINEALAKKKYRAHNAHVLQNAPKDQLLIYNVSEGWEPLCAFLKVPVPNSPFPHKNVRGNISKEWLATDPLLIKMQREMYFSISAAAILLSYGIYKVVKNPPSAALSSGYTWLKDAFMNLLSKS
ncbi:uncharacterized protein LOC120344598 [Styela clava]